MYRHGTVTGTADAGTVSSVTTQPQILTLAWALAEEGSDSWQLARHL
jgi:hypothetical protein